MVSGRRNLLKIGGPFIAFMVAGSYALTYFTDIRYWVSKNRKRYASVPVDGPQKKVLTLEEVYQEEIIGKSFEDWDNIRAPRVWEPDTIRANEEKARKSRQEQAIERLRKIEERASALKSSQ